jgi:radical SAM superfamily enzyme YgiQ (UPF0313 family)
MKALMVYPKFPPTYWSYTYALRFVHRKSLLPPLGLITVAALLPKHWEPKLIDLNIESLSDREIKKADVVMLTGMHVQRHSLHEVLKRCRRLRVPTIVGGPYATSEPHLLEDADYLVLGEAEETLADFCAAFEAGRAPRVTRNDRMPDVTTSPVPRFDLLKRHVYHHMSLQYSRGCPFTCDFCDIIVMFGRTPRTKSAEQVDAELDGIRSTGFRGSVFFVDDNFIGNKKAVRTLMPRIKSWQERNNWPFDFYTEASLNIAEDSALMTAMAQAGFESVFIGIESPSEASLLETRKAQNVRGSIVGRVHEVLRHGLDVWAGFIVGFDSDGPDIFEQQIEFIEKSAVPFAMIGILHALPGTPLHARLKDAGRLRPLESTADHFGRTNFETKIPEPALLNGYQRILQTIYDPRKYLERVHSMLRIKGKRAHPGWVRPAHVFAGMRAVLRQGVLSRYRFTYWRFLWKTVKWDPSRLADAIGNAAAGHHFIEYTRRVVIPRLRREHALPHLAALPARTAGGGGN